ncbi:putative receptor-like protein kinase [Ananas comosus]|uniref:Putative receptor-like protein kinase n=1 Tax=Ananas comosus TaxID=4615 RepID=A0A199W4M1_ANACO|nr:putative receptor-like protein kinase [Ananas comosus]
MHDENISKYYHAFDSMLLSTVSITMLYGLQDLNLLLDLNFTPKIIVLMIKLYPKDYSRISINAAKRTTEYIALELISRNFGIISCKSDVYSFRMLLMEMARGRRNVDCRQRIHARFITLRGYMIG